VCTGYLLCQSVIQLGKVQDLRCCRGKKPTPYGCLLAPAAVCHAAPWERIQSKRDCRVQAARGVNKIILLAKPFLDCLCIFGIASSYEIHTNH
jgi:hypothetical protein